MTNYQNTRAFISSDLGDLEVILVFIDLINRSSHERQWDIDSVVKIYESLWRPFD